MTWLEPSTEISQMIRNTRKSFIKKIGSRAKRLLGRVSKYVKDVFPEFTYEKMKNDIWKDMSAIYYKYEIVEQKQAFREIIGEISEKMIEKRWDNVYKKLYDAKKNPVFH